MQFGECVNRWMDVRSVENIYFGWFELLRTTAGQTKQHLLGLFIEACHCIIFPIVVPKVEDRTETSSTDQKVASADEFGDDFEDDFDEDDFEDP